MAHSDISWQIWNYLTSHSPPTSIKKWGEFQRILPPTPLHPPTPLPQPASLPLPPSLSVQLPNYTHYSEIWKRNNLMFVFYSSTPIHFNQMMKRITTWLNFLIFNHYISPMVKASIYFYWTPWKKQIDIHSNLTELNVNTGFTTQSSSNSVREVVIFRAEEAFKVFLHESFHLFSLDVAFTNHLAQQGNRCMRQRFGTTCRGKLYEAYTETWARILYTFYSSPSFQTFQSNLRKQITFANQQAQLVKEFRNIQPLVQETTSVFAYYDATSLLLNQLQNFWEYCLQTNGEQILKMPPTKHALHRFCQLLSSPPRTHRTRSRTWSRTRASATLHGKSLRMTQKMSKSKSKSNLNIGE